MYTKGKRIIFNCGNCGRRVEDYASNRKKTTKTGHYFCSVTCAGKGRRKVLSLANGGDGILRTKKEKDALHYRKNADKIRGQANNYYSRNKLDIIKNLKDKSRILKKEVMAAYGGKCECCGERYIEFLTIDHINGDGAEHRAKCGKGRKIYQDIKKQGFPQDKYRCLCLNCNISLGFYGYCPHKPLLKSNVDHRPKNPGRKRTVL